MAARCRRCCRAGSGGSGEGGRTEGRRRIRARCVDRRRETGELQWQQLTVAEGRRALLLVWRVIAASEPVRRQEENAQAGNRKPGKRRGKGARENRGTKLRFALAVRDDGLRFAGWARSCAGEVLGLSAEVSAAELEQGKLLWRKHWPRSPNQPGDSTWLAGIESAPGGRCPLIPAPSGVCSAGHLCFEDYLTTCQTHQRECKKLGHLTPALQGIIGTSGNAIIKTLLEWSCQPSLVGQSPFPRRRKRRENPLTPRHHAITS